MKNLLILLTLLCLVGCFESEDPLEPTLKPTTDTSESDFPIVVLEIPSRSFLFYDRFKKEPQLVLPDEDTTFVTQVGKPSVVYVMSNGQLERKEIIFQAEYYHLVWCFLDSTLVLANVLEHQIPYVSQEAALDHLEDLLENDKAAQARLDELQAEQEKKVDNIVEAHNLKFNPAVGWVDAEGNVPNVEFPHSQEFNIKWEKEYSIHPFYAQWYGGPPDQLEVKIKGSFAISQNISQKSVLFVEILRNITRPHITY